MKRTFNVAIFFALFAAACYGQLLSTAETYGKGNVAMTLAGSGFTAPGAPTSTFSFLTYTRGITDRVDLCGGVGMFTVSGRQQVNLLAGTNVNLLKKDWLAIATYQLVGTGVHRRDQSSNAWWYPSIIVSKNFKAGKQVITPYVGYAVTVPLGNVNDKTFTWADPVHNLPVGVAIPRGKWIVLAEYNAPLAYSNLPKVHAVAVAVVLQFPKPHPEERAAGQPTR